VQCLHNEDVESDLLGVMNKAVASQQSFSCDVEFYEQKSLR